MDFATLLAMLDADELDRDGMRMGLSELSDISEGANARIAELEAENNGLNAKYTDIAAKLWEMTQAQTAPADPDPGDGEPGDDEPETDEEAFGDLFDNGEDD